MISRILARIGAWLGAPTLDDYASASPGADAEPDDPSWPPRVRDDDTDDAMDVRHRNGVSWYDAPIPDPGHACWVQTSGWVAADQYVRCACGALCTNPCNCCEPAWIDRNRRARDAAAATHRKGKLMPTTNPRDVERDDTNLDRAGTSGDEVIDALARELR